MSVVASIVVSALSSWLLASANTVLPSGETATPSGVRRVSTCEPAGVRPQSLGVRYSETLTGGTSSATAPVVQANANALTAAATTATCRLRPLLIHPPLKGTPGSNHVGARASRKCEGI